MVYITKLSRYQSKAVDSMLKSRYERPQEKKLDAVYSDMQREVNRMVSKDSGLRQQMRVKPR